MTVEKLTEFRQLFEDHKKFAKDKGCYVLNLLEAREALAQKTSAIKITLEEFNTFFADQIAQNSHFINDADFSDLISKYEDEIFQMAGIEQ